MLHLARESLISFLLICSLVACRMLPSAVYACVLLKPSCLKLGQLLEFTIQQCLTIIATSADHVCLYCTTGNGIGAGSELCMWSVMVLPDGTMVSGDSTGTLQLWDGRHGTLLQAFTQHKADILSIAASQDGNMLFAAGIDVQVSLPCLCLSAAVVFLSITVLWPTPVQIKKTTLRQRCC